MADRPADGQRPIEGVGRHEVPAAKVATANEVGPQAEGGVRPSAPWLGPPSFAQDVGPSPLGRVPRWAVGRHHAVALATDEALAAIAAQEDLQAGPHDALVVLHCASPHEPSTAQGSGVGTPTVLNKVSGATTLSGVHAKDVRPTQAK